MKKRNVFSVAIILALLLALLPGGESSVQAQTPEPELTRDTLYVPGEVVVGFDRDLPEADIQTRAAALAGSVGAMVVDQYANMVLLSADPAADVISLADQLAGQSGVAFAEPNYISWIPESDPLGNVVQLSEVTHRLADGGTITRSIEELKAMRTVVKGRVKSTFPSDEFFNWGNAQIEHDIIWINRNASPAVCVIDTGVDDRHPDLRGRIIRGYDFVNDDKIPNDDNGHGTHVSGTIAAKSGNGIGPAGISNGKVLAVKALSAQGWGTDFDISEAIYYCANNTSVKVINMSLGGGIGTQAEYFALDYAINYQGKLVVASAGNDSISGLSYPAGWAKHPTIGHGLLSVGASRIPTEWYGSDLWVDTNGDDIKDSGETHNWDDCATWFSNYGSWVEIVAPGESIYSTLPVSYGFWNNYYQESAVGYESWNGTSMAAPHVAGAAARVWSFYPTSDNFWVHDRLLDSDHSRPLALAVDPNVPFPSLGYDQNIPAGPGAGQGYGPIDYDVNSEEDSVIRAPFCWPDGTGPFGAAQDMSDARFLSVAAAMERGAFELEVTDATTGLPLQGATILIKHGLTGKTINVAKMTSTKTRYVHLINVPAQNPAEDLVSHPIYVNKKGYTAGNQIFSFGLVPTPGYYWAGIGFQASVPPKRGTTVVANWSQGYDLNLYAWLPISQNTVVGLPTTEHPSWTPGTLRQYPYARWHRDGGGQDALGVEAITIENYPRTQYPYYLSQYPNDSYQIFLHDDGDNWSDLNDAEPILRIWRSGKNIPFLLSDDFYHYYLRKTDACEDGEAWWKAATITRSGTAPVYTSNNECGTGSTDPGGVWPYAEVGAIFSVHTDE